MVSQAVFFRVAGHTSASLTPKSAGVWVGRVFLEYYSLRARYKGGFFILPHWAARGDFRREVQTLVIRSKKLKHFVQILDRSKVFL